MTPPGKKPGGGGGSALPLPLRTTLRQATLPFSRGGGSGGGGGGGGAAAAATTKKKAQPPRRRPAPPPFHPPPGALDLGHGASLLYLPAAIPDAGGAILGALQSEVAWEQRDVTVWGRTVPQRRLVAYQANTTPPGGGDGPTPASSSSSQPYTYSGLVLTPSPWTPAVAAIKAAVEAAAGAAFDTCLLNLYRDGADAMAWHADAEAIYGPPPVTIASASFGASRAFQLRPAPGGLAERSPPPSLPSTRLEFSLGGGDVLIMAGTTQCHWQHAVPARARVGGVRVNLTFRATAAFKKAAAAARREGGRRVTL